MGTHIPSEKLMSSSTPPTIISENILSLDCFIGKRNGKEMMYVWSALRNNFVSFFGTYTLSGISVLITDTAVRPIFILTYLRGHTDMVPQSENSAHLIPM